MKFDHTNALVVAAHKLPWLITDTSSDPYSNEVNSIYTVAPYFSKRCDSKSISPKSSNANHSVKAFDHKAIPLCLSLSSRT